MAFTMRLQQVCNSVVLYTHFSSIIALTGASAANSDSTA